MFWNRALLPRAWYPNPDPIDDSLDFQYGTPEALNRLDDFFSDGSGGGRSADPILRRCGWGFVGLDGLVPCFGMGGGLPGPRQTVPRSELYAVISLLRRRPENSTTRIGVDCKYIVLGHSRSSETVALRDHADLWEEYHKIRTANNLTVNISKIC